MWTVGQTPRRLHPLPYPLQLQSQTQDLQLLKPTSIQCPQSLSLFLLTLLSRQKMVSMLLEKVLDYGII